MASLMAIMSEACGDGAEGDKRISKVQRWAELAVLRVKKLNFLGQENSSELARRQEMVSGIGSHSFSALRWLKK